MSERLFRTHEYLHDLQRPSTLFHPHQLPTTLTDQLVKDFAGETFVRNTKLPLKTPKVKFSPQLLKLFILRASLRLGKPEL